jgi:fluoroquinolone transport system permease protein
MGGARILRALLRADLRNILRDPMLRWMILFPLALGLLVRLGAPVLDGALAARYGTGLAPWHPLLLAFVILSIPMLSGMVIGFLLLDQRDDRTLAALQVTPVPPSAYLAYRLALPMALSLLLSLAVPPITGLPLPGAPALAAAALLAAPIAPFYALLLGALAANKVQGFALTKAAGVLLAAPVAAWFVGGPWQWLFGAVPLFWPAKLLWMAMEDASGMAMAACFLAGLAAQGAAISALLARFRKVVVG